MCYHLSTAVGLFSLASAFPGFENVCLLLLFYYKEVYVLVFPVFSAAFSEVGLLDLDTH